MFEGQYGLDQTDAAAATPSRWSTLSTPGIPHDKYATATAPAPMSKTGTINNQVTQAAHTQLPSRNLAHVQTMRPQKCSRRDETSKPCTTLTCAEREAVV